MAKNRSKLLEMFDEGMLEPANLVRDLINWLDDAEVKQFCEANDIQLFDEELDEDEDED